MKAKTVNENIGFERGSEPSEIMKLGYDIRPEQIQFSLFDDPLNDPNPLSVYIPPKISCDIEGLSKRPGGKIMIRADHAWNADRLGGSGDTFMVMTELFKLIAEFLNKEETRKKFADIILKNSNKVK